MIDQRGVYEKSPEEDLQSMVKGLMGHKGRVRLVFGEPILQASSAEELAAQLDESIVANTRLYPTHRYAKMVTENSPTRELENHPAVQYLAAGSMRCRPLSDPICSGNTRIFGVIVMS